ncbi:MAG: circularly permuted type 2 ATP-grasp protein, partial [Rubrobacteraceae bacterium]
MKFERNSKGVNEVFFPDGSPRPVYAPVLAEMERMGAGGWVKRAQKARSLLLDEQYSFGIKSGDKTHPTDWMPRIVPAGEWERLSKGLAQRLRAINMFLRRLEAAKEEVVPRSVVESSILYDIETPNRFGPVPVRQIAFDVVAVESAKPGQTGGWEYLVLEENAKMPVGLAAMTRRRKMTREVFLPESYKSLPVSSLDGSLPKLGNALRAASPKGPDATLAVVSGGPEDQFYLDHHIYAQEMDALLAETKDLSFDGDGCLIHTPAGRRIDVIYERVDEDTLYAEVPGLLECHVEGKVHVLFAPNSEIIDDKGVYAFVPEMVRRYLDEEPLIENARTWSLAVEEDHKYVMEHFEELVVKSRGGYGGKEVMIGPESSREKIEMFRKMVEANPIEYIAQPTIDFSTHVVCEVEDNEFI